MAEAKAPWPTGLSYHSVEHLSDGNSWGFSIHYHYNNQGFAAVISTSPPAGFDSETAIERKWLDRLWELSTHDSVPEDEGDEQILQRLQKQSEGEQEVAREIADLILPTLQRLAGPPLAAPPPPPKPTPEELEQQRVTGPPHGTTTVSDLLFPPCTLLEVVTKDGTLEVLSDRTEELRAKAHAIPWAVLREEMGVEPGFVPSFSAKDVVFRRPGPGVGVYYASVPGSDEELIGKLTDSFDKRFLEKELEKYVKLWKASLDPEARVPKLKGLITHGDFGILGILLTKISAKHASLEPLITGSPELPYGQQGRLISANPDSLPAHRPTPPPPAPRPSLERRQRWAAQIEHTVRELHKHGVTWGGVRPENVLIDVDDTAWVVDLRGSGTPGWMPEDEQLLGTVEGDLEVLGRVKEVLLREDGDGTE
ncbi:hypothetical protein VTJ49DRAFT_6291 [Mycothermus thermophilus]|uniref:Protein kinase domain-containing protein n=1 Tax=Humicola insolens TaxID=85995 RepID=A0ABR3VKS9_HUMIN